MLELNKNKICFWQRVCAGLYKLGDITVEQVYHSEGVCRGQQMWHVIVNGRTVQKWAYLKDAKADAYRIDAKAHIKKYTD